MREITEVQFQCKQKITQNIINELTNSHAKNKDKN